MSHPQLRRDLDPVHVDPQHYEVETENDRVRILRVRYGPREKSFMHAHPDTVVVFLQDCHLRMTYPNGRTEDRELSAGTAYYSGPEEHLPENLGDSTIDALVIELRR